MHVVLYSRSSCSFCGRARELLERHGVPFSEHLLDGDRARAERLAQTFGRRVMPYVLIDGEPVGGLAELEQWARAGRLDPG